MWYNLLLGWDSMPNPWAQDMEIIIYMCRIRLGVNLVTLWNRKYFQTSTILAKKILVVIILCAEYEDLIVFNISLFILIRISVFQIIYEDCHTKIFIRFFYEMQHLRFLIYSTTVTRLIVVREVNGTERFRYDKLTKVIALNPLWLQTTSATDHWRLNQSTFWNQADNFGKEPFTKSGKWAFKTLGSWS